MKKIKTSVRGVVTVGKTKVDFGSKGECTVEDSVAKILKGIPGYEVVDPKKVVKEEVKKEQEKGPEEASSSPNDSVAK